MKIEDLAKKAFENENIQPPKEAWDQISMPAKRKPKLMMWLSGIFLVGIIVPIAVINLSPDKQEEMKIASENIMVAHLEENISQVEVASAPDKEIMIHNQQNRSLEAFKTQPCQADDQKKPIPEQEQVIPEATQSITERPTSISSTVQPIHTDANQPTVVPKMEQPTVDQPKSEPIQVPSITPNQVPIRIPNLITPNGDGYNDCFELPNIESYANVDLQILNARGKQLYSKKSYQNDFRGEDFESGNYFYILNFVLEDGTNVVRRGVLVIKR